VTPAAAAALAVKLERAGIDAKSRIAMIHPAAAFDTKTWSAANFALVAEYFATLEMNVVAVGTKNERGVLDAMKDSSNVPVVDFDDLSLPEIAALAERSSIFVGNDSGIAHIASAVGTPSVVIFGSSNVAHWRPWTDARNEVVFEPFECQPCAGYRCEKFDEPKCILAVRPEGVIEAIERVLAASPKDAT
jgi:ADP-heptose:LPS heptosyltransferase